MPQFDIEKMFHEQEDWTEITEKVRNYGARLAAVLASFSALIVALAWRGVAMLPM